MSNENRTAGKGELVLTISSMAVRGDKITIAMVGIGFGKAYETGSAHFGPDFKNNVLTETNGMTLCREFKRKGKNDYGKNDEYKNRGEHIYKENCQTVYVVRYHFNEDAKETRQEKINRMLVTEASRQVVY